MENLTIDYYVGTATFRVDIEENSTKTTLKGMFKVKCVLSSISVIQADAMYRELLGKHNPQFASDYISQLCYGLSQLKYRILDAPDWWKNKEIGIDGSNVDDNVLLHVLEKAVEAEEEYRKGIAEKAKIAKGEVVEAVDEGTLTDGEESLEEELEKEEAEEETNEEV